MTSDLLAATVTDVASTIPTGLIDAWADVLATVAAPTSATEAALIDSRPGYAVAAPAHRLVDAWQRQAPQIAGAGIALALRAAALAHDAAERRRCELVITGPTSSAVPVRLTSTVVTEVIRSARQALLVVSFAAYGVADVLTELRSATDRGVRIDLVLEGTTVDGGTLRGPVNAAAAFEALRGRARFWYWPAEHRPVVNGTRAALHAKIIAADAHTALISSANLTDRALANNLEVGIVVHDPPIVERLLQHFTSLMNPRFENGLRPTDPNQ